MVTTRLGLLLILTGSLAACTKPEMDIGSLGRQMPAPSLKANTTNDDFPDSKKFLQYSGSCDQRVDTLYFGFKLADQDITYFEIPATTSYNHDGLTETADLTATNDVSCSDGTFDFILSLNDVMSFLGVSTVDGIKDANVEALYIAGKTLIGMTEALVIDVKGPDSYSDEPPVRIALEKTRPFGAAITGECFYVQVKLYDAQGRRTWEGDGSSVSFGIQSSAGAGVTYYNSFENCSNNTGAISNYSYTSSSSGYEPLVVKAPVSGASFTLQPTTPRVTKANAEIINIATANLTEITLMSSTRSATLNQGKRYLAAYDHPHVLASNLCYQFEFNLYTYDNTSDLSAELSRLRFSYQSTAPGYAGSNTAFTLYTDSSCTTPLNNSTLTASSGGYSGLKAFVKYTPTSGLSSQSEITITATDPNSLVEVFADKLDFYGDSRTSSAVISNVNVRGSGSVKALRCEHIHVELTNSNSDRVTHSSPSPLGVTLQTTLPAGSITFYSDANCSGTEINNTNTYSVNFSKGESRKVVSYKILNNNSSSHTVTPSAAGFSATPIALTQSVAPYSIASIAPTPTGPGPYIPSVCYGVDLVMMSDEAVMIPAIAGTTFNFNVSNLNIYSNDTCSSPVSLSGGVLPVYGTSTYRFWIKGLSAGSGFAQITPSGSATTGYLNITF